jgi:hypothetical protein
MPANYFDIVWCSETNLELGVHGGWRGALILVHVQSSNGRDSGNAGVLQSELSDLEQIAVGLVQYMLFNAENHCNYGHFMQKRFVKSIYCDIEVIPQ